MIFSRIRQSIGRFLLAGELRSAKSEIISLFLSGLRSNAGKARRYLDYANEGYRGNAVVFNCVNKTMLACASVGLKLQRQGEDIPAGKEGAALMPLAKLLRRPNPNQGALEFKQRYALYMYLGGKAPLRAIGAGMETVGSFTRSKSSPELYWLRPDKVETKIDDYGQVSGHTFTLANGERRELTAEEVLVIRFPSPDNDYDGMSPMASIERIIGAYNKTAEWNESLMGNMAVPSLAFIVKGLFSRNPAERQAIRDDAAQAYGGAMNAGRPIMLDGDTWDLKQLATSPKDLDWINGNREQMRRICGVLGVPSILIGDPEASTFANYEAAQKHHYQATVIPLMEQLANELTHWLASRYGSDISIVLDTAHIPVLRQNETELYDRLAKADWLTQDDKREATEYPALGGTAAELPPPRSLGGGFGQFQQAALRTKCPECEGGGQVLGTLLGTPSLRTCQACMGVGWRYGGPGQMPDPPMPGPHLENMPGSLYPTPEMRAAKLDSAEAARIVWERKFARRMQDYWRDQKVRAAAAKGLHIGTETQHYVDMMLPLFKQAWNSFGTAAVGEAVQARAARGHETRAKLKLAWDIDDHPDVKDYLAKDLAERSKLINETTAGKIASVLGALSDEGKGTGDQAAAIEQLFTDTEGRGEVIARTEMARAQSSATMEAWSDPEMGLSGKEWIAELDDRARDSHAEADGQIVGIDEDFEIGGDRMPAPGMGSDPGENCNCRCAVAPVAA